MDATFQVAMAMSKLRCLLFGLVWPSCLQKKAFAQDWQPCEQYGLISANCFGRKRYVFYTHEAALICVGNLNADGWPRSAMRNTTAVCKAASADRTNPVCIPSHPSRILLCAAVARTLLLYCARFASQLRWKRPCQSQLGYFSHDLLEYKEARPTTVPNANVDFT